MVCKSYFRVFEDNSTIKKVFLVRYDTLRTTVKICLRSVLKHNNYKQTQSVKSLLCNS